MRLGQKQENFMYALGRLIVWAYEEKDIRIRGGDLFRDPRTNGKHGEKKGYGSANSVHKLKLACDLNIFIDGEWVTDSDHPIWGVLHEKWLTFGGAVAIPGDANHFSFAYNGFR